MLDYQGKSSGLLSPNGCGAGLTAHRL